jgi:hypothetical protein
MPNFEVSAAIRPQSGAAALILFLDFDGVLHPDPCTDPARLFEHAPRLVQVLSGYPNVSLVLSTAWRQTKPYEELLAVLPNDLSERIIGITPNFSDFAAVAALIPYRRQAECLRWLHDNRLQDQAWLALDDRLTWFTPHCENLIGCHPQSGFDAEAGARLRSALQLHRLQRGRKVDLLIE